MYLDAQSQLTTDRHGAARLCHARRCDLLIGLGDRRAPTHGLGPARRLPRLRMSAGLYPRSFSFRNKARRLPAQRFRNHPRVLTEP